ncbi:hypothetical protein [Parablautia muri]|uniref:hypothetical protein n=1 Tax=Parablautia muri TaxID=2320879 RepID=UPI00241279F6|nr:hypothetical protein [Parablautia muri]
MHDVDSEMQEFLSYVENTTDDFASQARSLLIKEIHKKVTKVKESREMEVEYMTLLQRDRENLELGTMLATKIIKLYHKGTSSEDIASSLQLDLEYVNSVISDHAPGAGHPVLYGRKLFRTANLFSDHLLPYL